MAFLAAGGLINRHAADGWRFAVKALIALGWDAALAAMSFMHATTRG